MLGPLLGYGFLAGATVDLPDDSGPPRRWWLRLAARRSVWVAIGPWWGSLVLVAIFFAIAFFDLWKTLQDLVPLQPEFWKGTWVGTVLTWAAVACLTAMWSYSWLWPARAALRRAARLNRLRHAFYRGLTIALAFVGSLFGSFWAATALWRSYFFDPRVMPLIVVAVGLAASSGCANTITYGEVRRRELFHAMLVAWVLGLALMWRWWSRRRA